MAKIKIVFGNAGAQFYCGIGDGVIDGIYGYADTQEKAMREFIKRFNRDKQFIIVDTNQAESVESLYNPDLPEEKQILAIPITKPRR